MWSLPIRLMGSVTIPHFWKNHSRNTTFCIGSSLPTVDSRPSGWDLGRALKRIYLKGLYNAALYDLSKDPKELNDLAAEYPEIVQRMQNFLDQAHTTAEQKKFRIPVLEK